MRVKKYIVNDLHSEEHSGSRLFSISTEKHTCFGKFFADGEFVIYRAINNSDKSNIDKHLLHSISLPEYVFNDIMKLAKSYSWINHNPNNTTRCKIARGGPRFYQAVFSF